MLEKEWFFGSLTRRWCKSKIGKRNWYFIHWFFSRELISGTGSLNGLDSWNSFWGILIGKLACLIFTGHLFTVVIFRTKTFQASPFPVTTSLAVSSSLVRWAAISSRFLFTFHYMSIAQSSSYRGYNDCTN